MIIKQVIHIVTGGVMIILVVVIIVLSCIIDNVRKQNLILKQEKNYLSQTLQSMKSEVEKQADIYKEKDELLLEVKKSQTLQEYLKVWEKINKSIK
jgi:hypothetical protein